MPKNISDKISVIIIGPPGSGKGTQAKLLSEKLDLFHLDTGVYLRKLLYSGGKNSKEIQRERKLNESGKLNTPSWFLKVFSRRIKEISKLGQSIIFSGSPRTEFEVSGGKNQDGLMKVLERGYGKKNIFIFNLNVPPSESLKRNQKRLICSVCKTPLLSLNTKKNSFCPFCGGKLKVRKDDKKKIIKQRLEEYKKRTFPVLMELKKKGYRIIKIDGRPLPYKVHERIYSYFR